uniref:Putative ovule protein n=1 Tax=Solanum chacoense TaxID=4108 RepID=A0A0V0HB60_SOLCH
MWGGVRWNGCSSVRWGGVSSNSFQFPTFTIVNLEHCVEQVVTLHCSMVYYHNLVCKSEFGFEIVVVSRF